MQTYSRYSEQSMLTDSDVMDIRVAHAKGNVTGVEIADLYGINRSTAERIIRNESWTHVPMPKSINRGKYMIYADGRIFSTSQGKFLIPRERNGQLVVELRANDKRQTVSVAYLVAKNFIDSTIRSQKAVMVEGQDPADVHFTKISVIRTSK